jgi:hypothetical protein
MAIASRQFKDFFVTSGGGADEINAARKLELETMVTQDVGRGTKHDIDDRTLGPLVYNLQQLGDDEKNTRTFVNNEDEMLGVIKGTFPTGAFYSGSWVIPITATDFMGPVMAAKKGAVDGVWGYSPLGKGFAYPWADEAYVEKFIPIGFKINRVLLWGSNVGGAGNEGGFKIFITALDSNAFTSLGDGGGSSANWGSAKIADTAVASANPGDGIKCVHITANWGDKADVIYGGGIILTQI